MTNFVKRKTLLRRIPGFRQRNPAAMVLALTWFGAAAFVMASRLWWGLAMTALPLLLFALEGTGQLARLNRRVLVSIAAGALMLLAMGGGLAEATRGASPLPVRQGAQTATPTMVYTASTEATGSTAGNPASTAQAATVTVGRFVASSQGEVYHLPDCASAKRIKPENLVAYPSIEDAEAASLRPCKKCKPDELSSNTANPTQTTAPGGSP